MSRSVLCIHSASGDGDPGDALDDDRAGQQRHQVAGRRVPEADGAAHDARGRPAAAVPQDRVAVAGVVVLQPVDPRGRYPGLAAQQVALAVRHQGEVAGLQQPGLVAVHLEPATPGVHDVEPHRLGLGRQVQPPGSGQLGPAVEGARHAQDVQRLAQGIGGGPGILASHGAQSAGLRGRASTLVDEWA